MKKILIPFALAIFQLLSTSTFAQTTFTGLVSDAWQDAGNWDNGLPANGNDATIPAGMEVVISGSLTVEFIITNNGFIQNIGVIINYYGDINNYGLIENAGVGYILNGFSGDIINFGTIDNGPDGEIFNEGDINNYGDIMNFGAIDNGPDGVINNYGDIINLGAIDNGSVGVINNVDSGIIDNNGEIHNEGIFSNNNLINNNGPFYNYNSFSNSASGHINNYSSGIFFNYSSINNYGSILNDGGNIYNVIYILNNGVIYNCFGFYEGSPVVGNPLEEINCGAPEVCDELDNDFDGEIDEDCGCTDDLACNYTPSATLDDESCTYPGCTNALACNYTPSAACDDGSCTFPGCIDQTACNYDPNAGCDDGNCTYPGCTNVLACNYTASAACDDGSCTFPGCTDQTACNYDQNAGCDDGSCTNPGCMNSLACNYSPSAACDDGSCTFPGCTEQTACNYDPNAGCDSGSCITNLSPCSDECTNADGYGLDFTSYYAPSNWAQNTGVGDGTILHGTGSLFISGSNNGVGQNNTDATIVVNISGTFTFTWNYVTQDENPSWDPAFYVNGTPVPLSDNSGQNLQNGIVSFIANAGDIIGFSINSTDSEYGEGRLLITNFTYPTPNEICGCTDPAACNFDPAATADDGNCAFPGCTDQTACNYNLSTGCDDGSCTYPGCTDTAACNYDPNAGCDSGSCAFNSSPCSDECMNADGHGSDFTSYYAPSNWSQDLGVGDGTILHQTGSLHISGSNNEVGPNNTEVAIVVNTSGTFTFAWDYLTLDPDGPSLDPAYFINGSPIQLSDDLGQNLQNGIVSFIANAGDIIGFSINSDDSYYGEGRLLITNFTYPTPNEICGCTAPAACNFDPAATVDDGSCTYPGCTDETACNYDPNAGCDDSSCNYPGCTIAFACNYDPSAACDDGSCTYPGCTDQTACNYDPNAGCDSGSCAANPSPCGDECINTAGDGIDFTSYYAPSNWSQYFGTGDGSIDHNTGSLLITGANIGGGYGLTSIKIHLNKSGTYSFAWDYFLGSDNLPLYDEAKYGINGTEIQLTNNFGSNVQSGVVSFTANAGDFLEIFIFASSTYNGAANLLITNFTYTPENCGCMIPTACNFDPTATVEDGSCTYPGCAIPLACNYNPSAGCDDGSCEFTSCTGCMAITACNYNPLATIEDGSCEYSSCSGCTYASAVNYDSNAILDDGSCTFDQGGPSNSCVGDINADGVVNVTDLSGFLSAFGNSCE